MPACWIHAKVKLTAQMTWHELLLLMFRTLCFPVTGHILLPMACWMAWCYLPFAELTWRKQRVMASNASCIYMYHCTVPITCVSTKLTINIWHHCCCSQSAVLPTGPSARVLVLQHDVVCCIAGAITIITSYCLRLTESGLLSGLQKRTGTRQLCTDASKAHAAMGLGACFSTECIHCGVVLGHWDGLWRCLQHHSDCARCWDLPCFCWMLSMPSQRRCLQFWMIAEE